MLKRKFELGKNTLTRTELCRHVHAYKKFRVHNNATVIIPEHQ